MGGGSVGLGAHLSEELLARDRIALNVELETHPRRHAQQSVNEAASHAIATVFIKDQRVVGDDAEVANEDAVATDEQPVARQCFDGEFVGSGDRRRGSA
jgi:hypothetical protein